MLKEYHKFKYDNNFYLLNIEQVKAFRISEHLYRILDSLNSEQDYREILKNKKLHKAFSNLELLSNNNPNSHNNFILDIKPITHISINVAQTCNMKCIYCYGNEGEYGDKSLMKNDVAFGAVDWLIKQSENSDQLIITFFGGEPLLNFSLIQKIVLYANKKKTKYNKKFRFSITTNGTMFNDKINNFLNKNNFDVVVSYDGSIEMQKKNRPLKISNFTQEAVLKRIKTFLKSRDGNATARLTLTKYNINLQEATNCLIKMGFNRVLATEATFPNSNIIDHKENTYIEDYALNEAHQQQRQEYLDYLSKHTINCIKNRKDIVDRGIFIWVKHLFQRTKKKYFCGVGRGLVAISTSGEIYPCHRFVGFHNMKMGTINDVLPKDINRKYVENYGIFTLICKDCWARYFCGGGCIYEHIQANASPIIPKEEQCNIYKKSIELAIVTYDKLNEEDKKFIGFGNNQKINSTIKRNV